MKFRRTFHKEFQRRIDRESTNILPLANSLVKGTIKCHAQCIKMRFLKKSLVTNMFLDEIKPANAKI